MVSCNLSPVKNHLETCKKEKHGKHPYPGGDIRASHSLRKAVQLRDRQSCKGDDYACRPDQE